MPHLHHIAVLGAGGRAGQAVTATALARGHHVTAIVRTPSARLATMGVEVVAGDALDPAAVAAATVGASAIVSAVTPFRAPPPSFDGFDTDFYRRVDDTIAAAAQANGIARIVVVGLFAALRLPDGRRVADDDQLFPPALRPFAAAHTAGVTHLERHGGTLDWLVLAPPANFGVDVPTTGAYELGADTVDLDRVRIALSYADLAGAVLDQIEHPTRSREHVAVYGRLVDRLDDDGALT